MSTRACFDCGLAQDSLTRLPHGWLCVGCRRRRHYHPQCCPGCEQIRPLAWQECEATVCASCAGHESIFTCLQCGREDHPYAHRRCARCVLHERLTELLTDPATGQVHTQLVPLLDVMVGSDRPQTGIWWLRKRPGTGPALLASMARGEAEISHDTFRERPNDRAHDYLRTLLTQTGVLPPFDIHLERMPAWIEQTLTGLPPPEAALVRRFAHWHVLREMRKASQQGRLTQGATNAARRRIRVAVNLTTFLGEHGATPATATQELLERFHTRTRRQPEGHAFIRWLHRTGVNTTLTMPCTTTSLPVVTVPDQQRWDAVELLLHDTTLRTYTRVAGLFMLLFAQPLTRTLRMRTHQIQAADDAVLVRFHTVAVQMPPLLDDLVRDQLNRRGKSLYHSRQTGWLFPGGNPGRHLSTENVRAQLVDRGIHPAETRKAALFQLASAIPAPVLADLIGNTSKNAATWAQLAGRDWNAYIADRATTPLSTPSVRNAPLLTW